MHDTSTVANFDHPRGAEKRFLEDIAETLGKKRERLAAVIFSPVSAAAVYAARKKARARRAPSAATNRTA
jgi:hypothetical protein